jgi:pimeloyl-ACP methyl ester carboxylesterase
LGGIFSFEGLQNKLKAHYNTINLDLPGFGSSDAPSEHFTIYDYASVVAKFLETLNQQKVHIVSHSFGGRIAIILASLYQELVKKVVLIDAAGLKPKFSFRVFLKIKWYRFCKKLVQFKLLNKAHLSKFGSSDYKNLNEAQKKVFVRVVCEDLTYLLKNITAPTLLIWGKHDKDTPLYMAKKIKKRVKDCGLIAFSGVGHYSYLEKPFEVEQILLSFLK